MSRGALRLNVKVVGDSCLDIFSYCKTLRLAPDKPVPILEVLRQVESPGMAANTERNLQALGAKTTLVTNLGWEQVRKERFVDEATNHMFLRVDTAPPKPAINLDEVSFANQVVVISDYDKGFLSEADIEEITSQAKLVFLDSKKPLGPWALGVDIIKINSVEYRQSAAFIEEMLRAKTVWTQGSGGANWNGVNYPSEALEVIDVSGAGDSFMAGLVVGYLSSGDLERAIRFANEVAREVVSHRGVTVPTGLLPSILAGD